MSATPTPSVSSDQTRYYDALVMQFPPHTDDATGKGSSSADPRPGGENNSFSPNTRWVIIYHRSLGVSLHFAASGNPSGTDQPSHTQGTGSSSKHADDEAGQKTPSLRSLPTEPAGQESQMSIMKTVFGGTGGALGRKESVRTTRSTHTTGTTSAFANGAPLTGPNADPDVDESLFARGAKAERSLSQKQKDRIAKEESRFSNRNLRIALTQN